MRLVLLPFTFISLAQGIYGSQSFWNIALFLKTAINQSAEPQTAHLQAERSIKCF